MSARTLLAWQWAAYAASHQTRANLLIHMVAVPLFLLANAAGLWWLLHGRLVAAAGCAVVMALAFAAQGIGHGREAQPAAPFRGPRDAAARILLEQWVTFPRYVLSGRWWRALRAGGATLRRLHS